MKGRYGDFQGNLINQRIPEKLIYIKCPDSTSRELPYQRTAMIKSPMSFGFSMPFSF